MSGTAARFTPKLVLGVALVALALLAGCTARSDAAGTMTGPGQHQTSPSGAFEATLVSGAPDNGVDTLVPVISESGTEVFRDTTNYSTRMRFQVTWQADADVLWIVSSDVGIYGVSRHNGTWAIDPALQPPAAIKQLHG